MAPVCGIRLKQSAQIPRYLSLGSAILIALSTPAVAEDFLLPAVPKKVNIDATAITRIVGEDITLRQALVTADFSREIYDESCKFQDEIDVYPLESYVKGTKALFNAERSHVDLAGPVELDAVKNTVTFPFKETLSFNIPFHPYVYLTGRVELSRGANGLIVYSREFWDDSVPNVLSHIKF